MAIPKHKLFDTHAFETGLAQDRAPLARFRAALTHGREALRAFHLEGASGPDVVAGYTWLIDQLLIHAWNLHRHLSPAQVNMALIAVGGYGRGELHPASDVDLMILLEKNQHAEIRAFTERLLSFLWDLGLQVGHSVRSVRECRIEAKQDITVATNVMEARLLAGDQSLLDAMTAATAPPKVWPSKAFFEAKWQEQIARHQRFHDTAYNLEPNLKEGPGGLRDIQMIAWVAQRHFGTRSLHDLVAHGFLTEEEYRTLIRDRNFLWKLRNGLHFLANRREDRLLFDHQRALAKQLHHVDRPGRLAVEQLMKRYYRTIKELSLLNEILLQHFQEAILTRPGSRIANRTINRRFHSHRGFLEVSHSHVFERSPYAMLELFLILAQHPELKGVRASTIRLLRSNLHRIDADFRRDIACRSLFMEIMRSRQGITHALRRMNAYDVLGSYIPAFGRIVGQMQHDLFHVYTVDEHSLMVVRNLRRLAVPQFRHEFPMASDIIRRIVKPERLYLAGLFHDIAKGRGGDHSELGEREAFTFCKLHDMSDYDAHFVAWLVRRHLLMSWTAQHEDINDPEVVLRFARMVGDQEHLNNLYLLTMADMRGTSPKVWNAWKGRLLSHLYDTTMRVLRRGGISPVDVEERIGDLKGEALRQLQTDHISTDAVQRHWEVLDTDYFMRHDAESIAWHARNIVNTACIDLPLVAARYHPDHDGLEFLIFAPERDDLFANITGGFDRLSLNIADARIHSTKTGFALDTFVVLGQHGEPLVETLPLPDMQRALRQQLIAPQKGRDPLQGHLPRSLKHFPIRTRVSFAAAASGQSSVMEVVAQDRPGLLHQVALAMLHCKVMLVTAKVATYGERAEDIFFIVDRDGNPLTQPEQYECLEREVFNRLGEGGESEQQSAEAVAVTF